MTDAKELLNEIEEFESCLKRKMTNDEKDFWVAGYTHRRLVEVRDSE